MSVCLLLLLGALWGQAQASVKLAPYYTNHMVLQRGPSRAVLRGTADTEGDSVTAQVRGHGAAAVTAAVQSGKWKLQLPAMTDPGPFVIDVTSGDGGHVTLHDVLFGDVWLCSGQSNMQFEMKKVMNSSAEIEKGVRFNTIRYMKVGHVKSATRLDDVTVDQPWTAPTRATLSEFSAVCFLFAEYLQPHVNWPIGLVGTYWGGTSIEAWSPPESTTACPAPPLGHSHCCPHEPQVLWNAMLAPLLSMTIKGALWYQGEANVRHPTEYSCQMKSLVQEWRRQFHQESLQQTSLDFPFGYVQLADTTNVTYVGGFPALRWAQTANHGFSPNPDLPGTFMAVAMDLPDVHSPYGAIHPRYKQEVAERLSRGAQHVAYQHQGVQFQGPFPSSFSPNPANHSLTITYQPDTVTSLDIRSSHGFDVCCSSHHTSCDSSSKWVEAPITGHTKSHVTVDVSGCGADGQVVGVRYAWRQTPCPLLQCAVYDSSSGLPAPPFLRDVGAADPIG
ncbi:sialate O-acetylesterase-like [Babylonia areolata]|uniref:sialate O-acetylesterase-like n=1 Tax=Babylonia areolata TaxID=304850 RepID=UPI003FD6BE1C